MGIRYKVQSHKSKIKKETNGDTFRRLHNTVNPECHRSMTSHFNVIKKGGKKLSNKGDADYYKHSDSVKNQ